MLYIAIGKDVLKWGKICIEIENDTLLLIT